MPRKNKWSIPFVLLFLALAINSGLEGGLTLAMALSGAILIILGQKTVFGDKQSSVIAETIYCFVSEVIEFRV